MNIKKKLLTVLSMMVVLLMPTFAYASEMIPLTGDDRETPWMWALAIIVALVILLFVIISAIVNKRKRSRK